MSRVNVGLPTFDATSPIVSDILVPNSFANSVAVPPVNAPSALPSPIGIAAVSRLPTICPQFGGDCARPLATFATIAAMDTHCMPGMNIAIGAMALSAPETVPAILLRTLMVYDLVVSKSLLLEKLSEGVGQELCQTR